jgi:F-type H+-transporting ATPase subunit epsilon
VSTKIQLQIVTPEGRQLDVAVDMVEIPTSTGQIGVLPGHAFVLTGLAAGELVYYQGDQVDALLLAGGYAEIQPDCVRIVADFATAGGDSETIDAACERARAALEEGETTPNELIDANLEFLRASFAQLQMIKARKRSRSN